MGLMWRATKATARWAFSTPAPKTRSGTAVRWWKDAENLAAQWMRGHGYPDARTTTGGADGGIDVRSRKAIAQVKMEGKAVGRPALQRLVGARGNNTQLELLFFSASGYTDTAKKYANEMRIALLTYDTAGHVRAANGEGSAIAFRSTARMEAREKRRAANGTDTDTDAKKYLRFRPRPEDPMDTESVASYTFFGLFGVAYLTWGATLAQNHDLASLLAGLWLFGAVIPIAVYGIRALVLDHNHGIALKQPLARGFGIAIPLTLVLLLVMPFTLGLSTWAVAWVMWDRVKWAKRRNEQQRGAIQTGVGIGIAIDAPPVTDSLTGSASQQGGESTQAGELSEAG